MYALQEQRCLGGGGVRLGGKTYRIGSIYRVIKRTLPVRHLGALVSLTECFGKGINTSFLNNDIEHLQVSASCGKYSKYGSLFKFYLYVHMPLIY